MNNTFSSANVLRFVVLGSGSEGNAMVIECQQGTQITRLLLDCGFSSKELDKRLGVVGLMATDLDAVLITHEHHDHAAGAYRAAKRWRLPLHSTFGTLTAACQNGAGLGKPPCAAFCYAWTAFQDW
jgi:phosphoribosyl 1,2-cyclic phosphodiesterase